ncbi:hypothetical protein F4804DRAFT_341127 [Jackrogersella minutella]|nr:hypothetical protein F4804DRAFT_341127 [Jackrogersella minutella]
MPLRGESQSTLIPRQNSPKIDSKIAREAGIYENSKANFKLEGPNIENGEPISWWWWWEILAIILSITCICGLGVLLAKIDDAPLQSWSLPIQPNSLVAALITVAKASMMLVVASCIGQLKWRHFAVHSRRLVDLQLFDNASRGPWGSAILLWTLCFRVRVLVMFGFALITYKYQVLLSNTSAELGVANTYFSKGFLDDITYGGLIWVPNSDLPALQASLINGATGSVFKPYLTCPQPASKCQWDTFTTLGVCATFANVTDIATPECTFDISGIMNCTYNFPAMIGFDNSAPINMLWDAETTGGAGPTTMLFQSSFDAPWQDSSRDMSSWDSCAYLGSFLAVNATTNGYPIFKTGGADPPPVNVFAGTLTWCVQTFRNVTSSQTDVTEDLVSSENLMFGNLTSHLEGINTMGADYYSLVANSTGISYNISYMVLKNLPVYLGGLLSATVYHSLDRPEHDATGLLENGYALQHLNLEKVITDVAKTVTNQMRSKNPGDNYNASITTGMAFTNVTYIHVRFGWIALPLAEVVLTAFLLVVSVVITRKQPLLKDSVIALLMSKLEGWPENELNVTGPQTQEKLDDLAEKMVAKLETDSLGRLRFERGF